MSQVAHGSELAKRVAELARADFTPHYGELASKFPSDPLWQRLREVGSELWLDTGNIEEIEELWRRQFTALTTNNTLLNREVQKGAYDELIVEAAGLLAEFPDLSEEERKLEFAFILNARHGLRLVELFDAYVSVEEHTDLAHDEAGAVNYARRYHAICPERFYVKIPLTAEGLLATRRLSAEGIPVNHTLGFSARQNYMITRIGRPGFVNVFMGRLNSFVADNGLGDGSYVGERATLASQAAVRALREERGLQTLQIGASFRQGEQVRDLAGIDVMTIPPKAAREFLDLGLAPDDVVDKTGQAYTPGLSEDVDPDSAGLNTLWDVDERLVACLDELEGEELDSFTGERLLDFFEARGCGDVLVRWSEEQVRTSAEEGKIPRLENWGYLLAEGAIGLDSLMNLAGYNSFDSDQRAMDQRVQDVLGAA
ncbi:MAG: transaldolase family protein [Planctomycetota bacterium]|jgi:transaldolase